eukprot:Nitzschia sp. Nitz4//scaffold346_size17405//8704//9951//NITZ4_008830-RA/size17405-processed-gene-0.1-mRNA-1//1//CDS//3329548650//2125//frame0
MAQTNNITILINKNNNNIMSCVPNKTNDQGTNAPNKSLNISEEALDQLAENVSSFWTSSSSTGSTSVPILQAFPSPLQFHRDFVSKSRPCLINVPSDLSWPSWTLEDVCQICGPSTPITVNVTPDGHGDAVRTVSCSSSSCSCTNTSDSTEEQCFVFPEERTMTMQEFKQALHTTSTCSSDDEKSGLPGTLHWDGDTQRLTSSSSKASTLHKSVVYYSMQNDCLRQECPALLEYLQNLSIAADEETVTFSDWAQAVCGTGPPDAINLWVGNEQAHSSLHKDFYENFFYVTSGEKTFVLYPPSDVVALPLTQEYASKRFHQTAPKSWCLLDEDIRVPWMDTTTSTGRSTLETKWLHPVTIHVPAGCILYLPSLWFHSVTQTCETVGVNWWWDLSFETPLWCLFSMLQESRWASRNS